MEVPKHRAIIRCAWVVPRQGGALGEVGSSNNDSVTWADRQGDSSVSSHWSTTSLLNWSDRIATSENLALIPGSENLFYTLAAQQSAFLMERVDGD